MSVVPYGDRAVLVELDDTAAALAYAAALAAAIDASSSLAELVDDVVPGARTALVVARPGAALDRLAAVVAPDRVDRYAADARGDDAEPVTVEIEVTYDGPDLTEVAAQTGLAEDEVVAAHTGTPWRVAFGGFAPGFAYLAGGDPRLRVARRDTPRTTVPAGSVGLAGEFSGVYPRASPGGWQLIGTTDRVLWDLDRDPPALLAPGATVRFVAR